MIYSSSRSRGDASARVAVELVPGWLAGGQSGEPARFRETNETNEPGLMYHHHQPTN